MKPFEIIEVPSLDVACDGGGALGHPRVWLRIDSDAGHIVCPYCSRTYALRLSSGKRAGGH